MTSEEQTLRVAIVQYAITTGEPEVNFQTIERLLLSQKESKVDLFVLPEVCLTGFGGGAKAAAFSEEDPFITAFFGLAEKSGAQILAGFRIQQGNESFNRALLLDKKGIVTRYDKRVLFSYWNEHKLFSSGSSSLTFTQKGFEVAPFICYELRFPELFRQQMGVHLMTVIANWPDARRHHWITLLRARAIENQCYVAGVNRLGDAGEAHFIGDSVIIDPLGKPILELHGEEGCPYADLSLTKLLQYRKDFPALADAPS